MADTEVWTIKSLLTWTSDFFKKKGVESPRLEAEVLLAHALNASRIDLLVRYDEQPSEEDKAKFRDLVRRRGQGEPVAYLVGKKEFYTLDFEVDRNVLVPRPETEELAMAAIEHARKSAARYVKRSGAFSFAQYAEATGYDVSDDGSDGANAETNSEPEPAAPAEPERKWLICDVGTGSGCIAVSIANELTGSKVTAIDISEGALGVAKKNAAQNGVDSRIEFLLGDLLEPIPSDLPEERKFDIIVSNPPYVSEPEYAELEPTVRNFEPKLALVGGPTGAELPIRLLSQAPDRLKHGGRLFMELSPTTVEAAAAFAEQDGRWTDVRIVKDFARLDRFVFATRK